MTEDALNWLGVLQVISGPAQIRKYVENLLLEDSRGFHLKEQSKDRLPVGALVDRASRLRKKWHLEYLNKAKAFDLWVSGFEKSNSVQPISLSGLKDLEQAYQLNWLIKNNKSLEPAFWNQVRTSDRTAKNAVIKRILNVYSKGSYTRGLVLEILFDVWDDEAFDLDIAEPNVSPSHIPHFYPWVEDIHVWSGFGKIKTLGQRYLRGEFPQSELDLRASGMLAGVGFRHRAVQQGLLIRGDILPLWNEVKLQENDWQRWLRMDEYFYPKLQSITKKTRV